MTRRKIDENSIDEKFIKKVTDLQDETQQLTQELADTATKKADKTEVRKDTSTQPINVSEMDTETKQLFTGGAVAVVGENAVGKENVKNKAITAEKTNFFILSKNKFDKGNVVEGRVNEVSGSIDAHADYVTGTLDGVREGKSYTLTRGYKYVWLSDSRTVIGGGNLVGVASTTITAPSEATTLKFAIHKANAPIDTYMLVEGDTLPTTYESFDKITLPKEFQETQTGLSRKNLSEQFSLNPDLPAGISLNTVFADGNHTGIANGNYGNLPPNFNTNKAFRVNVSSMFKDNNRWAMQEFTQFDDLNNRFGRVVDKQGILINEWKKIGGDVSGGSKTLTDRVIAYFGDSTAEFGDVPIYISNYTGAIVHKCGFGGTRLAFHTSAQYEPFSFSKIIDAIVSENFSEQQTAIDNPAYTYSSRFILAFDLLKTLNFNNIHGVVIAYGTNDYMGTSSGVVPLGASGDSTRSTFYGAINYSLDKLLTKFPSLQVAFITPTWRENSEVLGGGEVDTTPNADGTYLREYVDAIINEAKNKYHFPVLDLYRSSGFNKYNKGIYLSDTVHPTPAGYQHRGKLEGAFLNSVFS